MALLHLLQGSHSAHADTFAGLAAGLVHTLHANSFHEDATIFTCVLRRVLPPVQGEEGKEEPVQELPLKRAKKGGHISTWNTLRHMAALLEGRGQTEHASFLHALLEPLPHEPVVSATVGEGGPLPPSASVVEEKDETGTKKEKAEEKETKTETEIEMPSSPAAVLFGNMALQHADEGQEAKMAAEGEEDGAYNPNAQKQKRKEAFLSAVLSGDSDRTAQLLEGAGAGAPLDLVHTVVDECGASALLLAALGGDVATARVLLGAGADPAVADKDGTTALLAACLTGCVEMYHLLTPDVSALGAGMLLNQVDKDGHSPLQVACKEGHVVIVSDILTRHGQHVNVNRSDIFGDTPLLVAAVQGHKAVVELLLAAPDIQPSLCNRFGDSPLLIATLRGDTKLARALVHNGCDKKEHNCDGLTAVEVAVWNNHEGIFQLLTEEDAFATTIQSVWRMYLTRRSIGRRVDQEITQGLQRLWSATHMQSIIKVQVRIYECALCPSFSLSFSHFTSLILILPPLPLLHYTTLPRCHCRPVCACSSPRRSSAVACCLP